MKLLEESIADGAGLDSAFNYYPMKLGEYVQIGQNCIIEAATIGTDTEIGDNCIVVS